MSNEEQDVCNDAVITLQSLLVLQMMGNIPDDDSNYQYRPRQKVDPCSANCFCDVDLLTYGRDTAEINTFMLLKNFMRMRAVFQTKVVASLCSSENSLHIYDLSGNLIKDIALERLAYNFITTSDGNVMYLHRNGVSIIDVKNDVVLSSLNISFSKLPLRIIVIDSRTYAFPDRQSNELLVWRDPIINKKSETALISDAWSITCSCELDESTCVLGGNNKKLIFVNKETLQQVKRLWCKDFTDSIVLSSSGQLISSHTNGNIRIWNKKSTGCVFLLNYPQRTLFLSTSVNNLLINYDTYGNVVRLLHPRTGELKKYFSIPNTIVECHGDEDLVAIMSYEDITFYNTATFNRTNKIPLLRATSQFAIMNL
ncbi:hypothetical protein AKO1_001759 [Acrasis kona]|uniref:Uncharacterized protein n=1 Tax=Acrasis kona TaxID=1008807 RepID=A0AAW2Z8I9_9EUKA